MPGKCAEGVVDWKVTWQPPAHRVVVEVVLDSHDRAARFADEMKVRLSGEPLAGPTITAICPCGEPTPHCHCLPDVPAHYHQ